LISFFLGGIVFLIYQKHVVALSRVEWIKWIVVADILGWVALVVEIKYGFMGTTLLTLFDGILTVNGHDFTPALIQRCLYYLVIGLLFPGTIFVLVVLETRRGQLGRRIAMIGDLSYSSYLLHFPLPIVLINITGIGPLDSSLYHSEYAIFGILIPLCFLSYHYFERPAQRYLRGKFAVSRK